MGPNRWMLMIVIALLFCDGAVADQVKVDSRSVATYILSCRKPNGAFGPADQEYTDAAWNYPAVHTLSLLGQSIPDKEAIVKHGLGFPKGHGGVGHWLFFHRRMIRDLINMREKVAQAKVTVVHQGMHKNFYYGSPFKDTKGANSLGYYNLSSLYYLLRGLHAQGSNVENPNELIEFIRQRQAPNGGFVDVRVKGAKPGDDQTHIAHTFQALASLQLLGAQLPNPKPCARYIKSCQLPGGAFLFDPDDKRPGNYPDIYYTWAGLRALELLGVEAANAKA